MYKYHACTSIDVDTTTYRHNLDEDIEDKEEREAGS